VTERRALVIGATGITGGNTVRHLADEGWEVIGVSRSRPQDAAGMEHVSLDVLDGAATETALSGIAATHLFFCTWSRQDTEARNIEVNRAMLRNVLDAAGTTGRLQHAALVTGLKHYLGPFEAYGKPGTPRPPYRESEPRLPYENFYYEQEDVLFEAADRYGFSWSVHRPHTMIGYALGNAMNMGVTLAVYGTLCRETGRPFLFPGSPEQHENLTDITDARLVARQLTWAATSPAAANEPFNIVNGDKFRWQDMWQVVASGLGVEPAPYPGKPSPLVEQMVDSADEWRAVAERHQLRVPDVDRLASWWHTDGDLGRVVEAHADMTKSREAGFTDEQDSKRSFLDLFDRLRAERVIP